MAIVTKNYGLEKLGFKTVVKSPPKRVVLSLFGQEGTGKNTFAFTMPKPIALIDLEMGYERAKLPEGDKREWLMTKTIFVPPTLETAKQYTEKWLEFKAALEGALKSGVPSIVIDTASAGWELLRLAQFGRLTQVLPIFYSQINPVWKALMQKARVESQSNICWIHRAKDTYEAVRNSKGKVVEKDGKAVEVATGDLSRDGFKGTGYEVDVELGMYMEGGVKVGGKKWARKARNSGEDVVYGCEVLKSGFGKGEMVGEKFESAGNAEVEEGMCNFPFVMSQLTGTDEERWK